MKGKKGDVAEVKSERVKSTMKFKGCMEKPPMSSSNAFTTN